jgi:hypothetical protein
VIAAEPLVAFVLARIGEEERDARAAMVPSKQPGAVSKGVWVTLDFTVWDDDAMVTVAGNHDDASLDDGHAAHIARQDPQATLARCAALRALVALHERAGNHFTGDFICNECDSDSYPCRTLRHAAAIWAWHEDYQEAWKA